MGNTEERFHLKDKWSYLAGIFDGEGNVTINSYPRTKDNYTYLQHEILITIKNTCKPLVKWLVETFGGVYYTTEFDDVRYKTVYAWRVKGATNKEKFLLGVLPYLIVKREQALLGLEYLRFQGENPEARKAMSAKMKVLNHRGKSVTTNTLDSKENIESELIGDNESAPVMTQAA